MACNGDHIEAPGGGGGGGSPERLTGTEIRDSDPEFIDLWIMRVGDGSRRAVSLPCLPPFYFPLVMGSSHESLAYHSTSCDARFTPAGPRRCRMLHFGDSVPAFIRLAGLQLSERE